jgi:tetratricopeptide (TPR) repeat protein
MLRHLKGAFRRHPRVTALVLALILLTGAGFGLHVYAIHQWQTAQGDLEADRPAEALRRLKLPLFLWSRSVRVHLLAARAARLSGDGEVAESHLDRCRKLHGGATEAIQLEYLLLRVQMGEVDEVAAPLLRCVDEGHPETALILETLARAYMHRLRYQPAYACLSRWIEEAPDAAKPYAWRAWVLERMNNPRKAMADYRRALEQDPEHFQSRLRMAEMLLEDNDPLRALPHLERLRRMSPDSPHVKARLGQCYLLQGKRAQARELLEAAQPDLPDDAPLLIHLAKLDLQQRPARAERWLRRVIELDPTETDARYNLVTALRLQGRLKEAARELARHKEYKELMSRINKLLQEEGQRPSTDSDRAAEIGILLLRIGRDPLALSWLHQALERNPRQQEAHRALADYYEKKGDRALAASHRRQLTEPRSQGRAASSPDS